MQKMVQETFWPCRRGQTKNGGNENTKWQPVWSNLLGGRKDKLAAACLKSLSTCKSEKYCNAK